MNFRNAQFEFLPIPEPTDHMGVLQHLERVGRVCYKSEEKITAESCLKFTENIRKRKHWAMLEHYVFVMTMWYEDYEELVQLLEEINQDNPDLAEKIRFIHVSRWDDAPDDREYLVSGSATAFNYLAECAMFREGGCHAVNRIFEFLYSKFPEIMNLPEGYKVSLTDEHAAVDHAGIRFLSRGEVRTLPIGLRRLHDFYSVKSWTDRGVSHEDVRHRPASWAQESTRYCNYGKLGCMFLIPCWFSEHDQTVLRDPERVAALSKMDVSALNEVFDDSAVAIWFLEIGRIADTYEQLLALGWNPQQARSILPNAVKTEIIMTAVFGEWMHYFNMRVPRTAHPQMRELVVPMFLTAVQKDPGVFAPQMEHLKEEVDHV